MGALIAGAASSSAAGTIVIAPGSVQAGKPVTIVVTETNGAKTCTVTVNRGSVSGSHDYPVKKGVLTAKIWTKGFPSARYGVKVTCGDGAALRGSFRVTEVPSTQPVDPVLEADKALIRDIFYQETLAWSAGTKAGLDFVVAHNYPGALDTAASAACFTNYPDGVRWYSVADLSTVSADPTWMLKGPGPTDMIPQTSPPAGRTYAVTIDQRTRWPGYADDVSKALVHVTILDGRAYYYLPLC